MTPFQQWREQQLAPAPPAPEPDHPAYLEITLDPRRQAAVSVAWCSYRLAKLRGGTGDLEWDRYLAVVEQQTAVQTVADHGLLPTTVEGALAVLDAAEAILAQLVGLVELPA